MREGVGVQVEDRNAVAAGIEHHGFSFGQEAEGVDRVGEEMFEEDFPVVVAVD